MMQQYKKQQAFAMLTVIFILVVIAGIASSMARLQLHGSQLNTLSIQESRAYYAAASGLDWAVTMIQSGEECGDIEGDMDGDKYDLYGAKIEIDCEQETYNEAGDMTNIYNLTSLAKVGKYDGKSSNFVSRQLTSVIYRK